MENAEKKKELPPVLPSTKAERARDAGLHAIDAEYFDEQIVKTATYRAAVEELFSQNSSDEFDIIDKKDDWQSVTDSVMSHSLEEDILQKAAIGMVINEKKRQKKQEAIDVMMARQNHDVGRSDRKRRKGIRFESMEQRLAMAGLDTPVWPQELPAGALPAAIEEVDLHNGKIVFDVSLSKDGSTFTTAGQEGKVKVFDAETGALKLEFQAHPDYAMSSAISPDGSTIVTTSYDRTLKFWDAHTGALKKMMEMPSYTFGAKYSPDGKYLAFGIGGKPTQLMELATGAVTNIPYSMTGDNAVRFAFSPDNKTFLHSDGSNVTVYDLQTKAPVRTLSGLQHGVYAITVDPQSRYVAAGANNGQTAVWDLQTGTLKVLQKDHRGVPEVPAGVWQMAFSTDGKALVSGDWSGNVITRNMANIATGEAPIAEQYNVGGVIGPIVSSPGSNNFLISSGDTPATVRQRVVHNVLAPVEETTGVPHAPAENPPQEGDPDFIGPVQGLAQSLGNEITSMLALQEQIEVPIEPKISVMEISGNTVRIAFQSPYDMSVVEVLQGGLLAKQTIMHKGGTQFSIGMITVDPGANPSRDFSIVLRNSADSDYLWSNTLHWDRYAKKLSLPNAYDQFQPDGQEAVMASEMAAVNGVASLTSAYLGDQHINWIQQIRLLEGTGSLPAGYNFMNNLDEKIYAVRPQYRPENEQAGIDALRKQMGTRYTRSQVADLFYKQRSDFFREMHTNYAMYEQGMGELLQKSVDVVIRARRGENVMTLTTELNDLLNKKWLNINNLSINRQYANPIKALAQINIYLPTLDRLMQSSLMVMNAQWSEMIMRQGDVVAYRTTLDALQESGYRVNAAGDVVAISEFTPQQTVGLTRSQITLANRINDVVKNSTDPRMVTYRDTLALMVARELPEDATQEMIVSSTVEAMADVNAGAIIQGSNIKYPLGNITKKVEDKLMKLYPNGNSILEFTLSEPAMVNFWLDSQAESIATGIQHDFSLSLSGTGLVDAYGKAITYTSQKSRTSGESISTILQPGTYSMVVRDAEAFTSIQSATVGINIQKYDNRKIEGRISIASSEKTMPVTMRVAEFDTQGQRRKDYENLATLKTDKPVWVVIHGRTDSDTFDQINELSQNLQAQSVQVITINWNEAASDNAPSQAGLQGSKWIEPTGKWIANQLTAMGFSKDNINLVGHSWGTFVTYEISKYLPSGAKTIVALDPAQDSMFLGSNYDEAAVDFKKYTDMAYAFHSSRFGNRQRALTADVTFEVRAPESYNATLDRVAIMSALIGRYITSLGIEVIDEFKDAGYEHGFAPTLFSQLLKDKNTNVVSSLFTPSRLTSSSPSLLGRPDHFEGEFRVDPTASIFTQGDSKGKTWWKADKYSFYGKDTAGNDIVKQ